VHPELVLSGCETISSERREQHMRKSRFSEERIIGILRRVENGQPLVEVCREEGISDATYY
jgi:Transposase